LQRLKSPILTRQPTTIVSHFTEIVENERKETLTNKDITLTHNGRPTPMLPILFASGPYSMYLNKNKIKKNWEVGLKFFSEGGMFFEYLEFKMLLLEGEPGAFKVSKLYLVKY
jgi:hypothetical protein